MLAAVGVLGRQGGKGGREGGRGEREGGREGGREGRKGGRQGEREGGRKGGREGEREGRGRRAIGERQRKEMNREKGGGVGPHPARWGEVCVVVHVELPRPPSQWFCAAEWCGTRPS